ncbi:MAG: hypothetical protein PHU86_00365 [Patescibacteria group bacterium]|nr:hypothetical protein [Patescibacteria group bacterium]
MKDFLNNTFLSLPIYVWILQLLYVAVALAILVAFVSVNKRATWEIVTFLLVVIIINIIWRLAIK